MENNKKKYIKELDGLRGLAILPVIFIHAGISAFKGGFIGVDIFFTLSGFLITTLLLKEIKLTKTVHFKKFYMRRILRLAPLFVLFIILYNFYFLFFTSSHVRSTNLIDSVIAMASMTNWAWAFSIHQPDLLRHTWSLSIEEQFYLVWPFILIVLTRFLKESPKILFVTISLACFSWVLRIYLIHSGCSYYRVYNGLDTRMDSIMWGCSLAVIFEEKMIQKETGENIGKLLSYLSPICLIILLGICVMYGQNQKEVYIYILSIVQLCSLVLIADIMLNNESFLKSFLAMKWLVWLGKISYGLYLLNYPIFRILFTFELPYSIAVIISISSSIIIASISYIYYEKYFIRLKRYFISNKNMVSFS